MNLIWLAWLTAGASVAAKGALAHQVWLNWTQKSVEGVSIPFFCIALASYSLWVTSGFAEHSAVLIWGQAPGVALCVTIAGQAVRYRHR